MTAKAGRTTKMTPRNDKETSAVKTLGTIVDIVLSSTVEGDHFLACRTTIYMNRTTDNLREIYESEANIGNFPSFPKRIK